MNGPLGVRGQVVERYFLATVALGGGRLERRHVQRRPEQRQLLTEIAHPGVILIKLRPAGQGAEGYLLFDIDHKRRVTAVFGFDAAPDRRGDDLAGLDGQVTKRKRSPLRSRLRCFRSRPVRRSRPVHDFTAVSPLVSGASMRMTSAACLAVTIDGIP